MKRRTWELVYALASLGGVLAGAWAGGLRGYQGLGMLAGGFLVFAVAQWVRGDGDG